MSYDCCPPACESTCETVVSESTVADCCGETVVESSGCECDPAETVCCEPFDCCGGYASESCEAAVVDDGYVSSYIVDSIDCGCGESVITGESNYIYDASSATTGTVVEEGYGAPVPTEPAYEGVIIQDGIVDQADAPEEWTPVVPDGETIQDEASPYSPAIEADPAPGQPSSDALPTAPAEQEALPDFEDMPADDTDSLMSDEPSDLDALDSDPADALDMNDDLGGADESMADDDLGELDAGLEDDVDDTGIDGLDDAGMDDLGDLNGDDANMDDTGEADAELDDALFDETPADDTPAEDDAEDLDDLFGTTHNDAAPQTFALRTWTDNTGRYQTEARLVQIGVESIRIFKTNGRFSTVPLNRLSAADLDYVQVVARATQDEQLELAAVQ